MDDRQGSLKEKNVFVGTAGALPSESGAVKTQVVRIIEEKQFPKA